MSSKWTRGYKPKDLERAQEAYELAFPPDLVALLLQKRPSAGYDWRKDEAAIRRALAWPADGLAFSVALGCWLRRWGLRPEGAADRERAIRALVARAPPLIPLIGHRYLPAEPCEADNPVLSVYGADIIYYGATLAEYFNIELRLGAPRNFAPRGKRIRFWSDIIEWNDAEGDGQAIPNRFA